MPDHSGDYLAATIRARKEAEEVELANRIARGEAAALKDAIMHVWRANIGKR